MKFSAYKLSNRKWFVKQALFRTRYVILSCFKRHQLSSQQEIEIHRRSLREKLQFVFFPNAHIYEIITTTVSQGRISLQRHTIYWQEANHRKINDHHLYLLRHKKKKKT